MKILVVVDMQNDFLTGALGNEDCRNTISKVVDVLEKGDYDFVYLTRDTHQTDYMETQEGKKLPVPHCIKDTEGWQLQKDVLDAVIKAVGDQYEIIDKPTFGSVTLGSVLRDKYSNSLDTEIEFVGVCTGICVISNVLLAKANLQEARIRVIQNACACVTPDTHQTALAAMRTCQIDII